jgi:uracil-DNA glycosylase family 4
MEQVAVEFEPPNKLTKTRRVNGTLMLAGRGKEPADIMFLATAAQEEEAVEEIESRWGQKIKYTPEYLKGPAGCILKDILESVGIDINEQYYTAVVKWLLPRGERSKPKIEHIQASMPILLDEIERVKPKLIVTFGKPAFEAVFPKKIKFDDIRAGLFYSKEHNCNIFVMPDVLLPVFKPEMVDKFRIDLLEVKKIWDSIRGLDRARVKTNYKVIHNSDELREHVAYLKENSKTVLSVDCEFGGRNFLDGRLRSLQICHDIGQAVYIRFMDDRCNYVFDVDYKAAGAILAEHLNQKHVIYIGHHISVDLPWMHHHLGLDWYNKCFMDTEFAENVLDETAEMGLERLALKYTDLGRYDIDLVVWKTENKDKVNDELGYLLVPDDILIPYACADVDGPFRAAPHIMQRLIWDNTWDYYVNYRNPMVSDLFTNFSLVGYPMDKIQLDELRKLFSYAKDLLEQKFVKVIKEEAKNLFFSYLLALDKENPVNGWQVFKDVEKYLEEGQPEKAINEVKKFAGASNITEALAFVNHYIDSPNFNLRSNLHKIRWLFHVKKHTPVKTTANKEKGMPSIPWEKVEELAPNIQKLYTPATDKQTLKVIADDTGDETVNLLLDVLAVGNVSKAFLKEADVDDEGNLVKENGLHYWMARDGRIHGQMSVTETGRPRAWKPNSLNWPSYVHAGVARGISLVLQEQKKEGTLPVEFEKYLDAKQIPSIRSVVDVTNLEPLPGSKGWCLVESDYVTAEIRGLAFKSGDSNLIRLMTEPDTQFGIPADGDPEEDRVRLCYADDCGIPVNKRNPEFIGKQVVKGKIIREVSMDQLMRNPDGSIMHPAHDLHWSLVEWVQEAPRELFDKKVDRAGTGKVGNFSSAYGATGQTLERKIRADTGKNPVPGTGDKILQALAKRQPNATAYLLAMEELPKNGSCFVAESGAKRRFIVHNDSVKGLADRTKKSILSTLGRQARNFPMQNSVADTAVRAGKWLLQYFIENNYHARPMVILYDSVVTLCPVEERFEVMKLHERFMDIENVWNDHGRTWSYPTSVELNYAWSRRPSKEQRKLLEDTEWHSEAKWLKNAK